MTLWLAALLALAALAGLLYLYFRKKKTGRTLPAVLLGVVLIAALGYLISGGLLLWALQDDPPTDPTETTAAAPATTAAASSATTEAPTDPPTEPSTEPPVEETAATLPADFEFPVDQVPQALPDPLGVSHLTYEDTPYLETPGEIITYLLNRFLNQQFDLTFYLPEALAPAYDEGAAPFLVQQCLNAVKTYYLFDAMNTTTCITGQQTEDGQVLFYLTLEKEEMAEEHDLRARAAAIAYVMRHPVPEGGFTDADADREYTRQLRNDLAQRLSYDPIGLDSDNMLFASSYDGKQEAYNALVEEDQSVVCAGYARGFALVAHYAGIDCAYVTGNRDPETDSSHAWNILYPCDGSMPELIDVTWDDSDLVGEDGRPIISDNFFYIPLDQVYDHTPDAEVEAFLRQYHPQHP